MKMKTVALFFGGPSNEHEVSITSAKNIVKYFPHNKYNLKLVYWDKEGYFYLVKNINNLSRRKKIKEIDFKKTFSIAFPITHGKYGEDGFLQRIFDFHGIKYCGCRALSSSLCMDKIVFKSLLSREGIRQVKFIGIDYNVDSKKDIKLKISKAQKYFNFPLYIKPSNSGSSIGISKVKNSRGISRAINEALKYDHRVIIEEGLVGPREIEVSVLGNDKIIISSPGELKIKNDFYSYDDKYVLNKTKFIIPAKLSKKQEQEIISLSERAYKLLCCSGFARVDFFISRGKVYVNEINSLPGFTDISMYPMLMIERGYSFKSLISEIIKTSQ
jgi:D-alanine-D-alanine ligase